MEKKGYIAAFVVAIIIAFILGWVLNPCDGGNVEKKCECLPVEEVYEEEEIKIFVSSSVEEGTNVSFRGELNHSGKQVGKYLKWDVVSLGGEAKIGEGNQLLFLRPGKVVLRASFLDKFQEREIMIFPTPKMGISLNSSWIHPGQWYLSEVEQKGVTLASLDLYKVLETGRRVSVSSESWEKFQEQEIVVYECGNYLLVAKAYAKSDGRVITAEKAVTVTPYVQRGLHHLSWENEDLVQLTPYDWVSIGNFIREDLRVNLSSSEFSPTGRLVRVNRISSEYLFYKDSTRDDTLLYQEKVSFSGETREMFFFQTKGSDGRYYYICWNDFFVSVNRGSPGASLYVSGGDSSGNGGNGGSSGPSPSPPI
ncbi:MAG: hypothetical protein WC178_05180 [Candidatus Paceibacterota bacterium]